ncbi:hypothetical protein [Nocardioides pacificus]
MPDSVTDSAPVPDLRLRRGDEHVAEIDALAARYGGRVGVDAVTADLNRQGRRTWAPGRAVRRVFTWDAADRRDPQWWPQGISWGSAGGREHFVTTWYAKETRGEKHGSRISFYDPTTRRYRHVLLVTATLDGETAGCVPLSMHAGGIVWAGSWLHVAATATGFHTFHVDDILRVPDAHAAETLGYRYVLPVRFTHRAETAEGVERLRYSFLSLDRSTSPAELLVGEYGRRKQTRRLARFPLDAGFLPWRDAEGRTHPLSVETTGVAGMQGAVRADGELYATTSHGPWGLGSVYVGEPGSMRRRRRATPFGPEDLTWWPETGLLWTVTEHPRRRWICGLARPHVTRS